ncbi:AraC family transcriptional regulator [Paenibacillus algorifonticola]|uniref:AraC family transcriptional regulator n=1 Tax=Paenibacillus algorifonticola TaxID=684063 RepID=A0A1I2B033_9BACL|nr:GyrI-like domain-containing protein [Paenibacillus algorifonticola]SFE49399.1 AraC family transcriptional regulator [Paenibacillus algorifonticola]
MEAILRMKDALDLMEQKMEERLDIAEIAKAAYVSPFHFQRMFHMLTGMTVAEYIRKRKLTLAAQELTSSAIKVVDVAFKYGYDSPESFSKAFRRIHGISPSEARAPGVSLKAFPRISFQLSLKGDKDMDYRIEEKEAFQIAGLSYEVSCKDGQNFIDIPKLWEAFNQSEAPAELYAKGDGAIIGVCLDGQPDKETFTYMIATSVHSNVAEKEEIYTVRTVPAATWAIFTSTGPLPDSIQNVFRRIFQEWFPGTGYEHAGGPELEVYYEGDTCAEDYRCEVWIPIMKKEAHS